MEGNIEKISYERRTYESVDDGSLSKIIYRKTMKKIKMVRASKG